MAAQKIGSGCSAEIAVNGFNYKLISVIENRTNTLTIKAKDQQIGKTMVLNVDIYTDEKNSMGFLGTKIVTLSKDNNEGCLGSYIGLSNKKLTVFVRELPKQYLDGESSLHDDFSSFFSDEDQKDVTFKFDEKEIKAHTAVLCARSSVFKSMLSNDMKEKISIEDTRKLRSKIHLTKSFPLF